MQKAFLNFSIKKLQLKERKLRNLEKFENILNDYLKYFFDVSLVYLSKMVVIDYDFISKFNYFEIASAIIKFSLSLIKKIDSYYDYNS